MSREFDTALEMLTSGPNADGEGTRHSRRALMTGAVAAGAGIATSMVLGTKPSAAADMGNLILGESNTASHQTSLTNTAAATGADTRTGLAVTGGTGTGGPNGGTGITGNGGRATGGGLDGAGVSGNSGSGSGLVGISTSGVGVKGSSSTGPGVFGASREKPGVTGITTGSGQAGVAGRNDTRSGYGVSGTSAQGTGVLASSGLGTALSVQGKVSFSRSGIATIPKGTTSITVKLAGVSGSSMVLATLQQVQKGVLIAGAVPGTNSFTIYLSQAPTASLKVAWFVIH